MLETVTHRIVFPPHGGGMASGVTADNRVPSLDATLLDLLSAGVVVIDPRGVIIFVNASAETLLGMAAIQIIGKHLEELPLKSFAYRVLSENSRDEATHVSGNGKYLWVRTRTAVDHSGIFHVVELHDRSEERKMMKGREESVAMMTHDLKSPLSVMIGYIQALRGASPSLVRTCIDELERGANRLLSMIEDMLDAYRMEAGLIQSNKGICPVGEILLEACAEHKYEAQHQGVRIEYDIPEDLPTILADSRQISRVFANILGNAVKFTPAGGSVFVDARREGDLVRIRFRDTGVGIPEEERERVFQKYFRSSRSKGYRGSGLGLAISRAFVEAHGGTIQASRGDGGGTVMEIGLPILHDRENDV
ncbi:MAG: hypothetical protein Fur0034_17350 [Desulfuromonadia bacterium]